MEKMMDRCGLFGMFDNNGFHTSHLIYYGLFSMQHRGMEAAGICVNDNQGNFSYVKDEGLVTEVFDEMKLEKLQGHAGIGHILRYDGSDARENAQPIVIRYSRFQSLVWVVSVQLKMPWNLSWPVQQLFQSVQRTLQIHIQP